MSERRRIDSIIVEGRHRQDLGDLEDLIASITETSLLHPVAITPDGKLLAGQRRLEACRRLGWTHIPVHVVEELATARALLIAERDENVCRLDMRPSEKVSLGLALEELERPKAKARQHEGQSRGGRAKAGHVVSENFAESRRDRDGKRDRSGETTVIVGEAVGMSRPTYERAKHVVRQARAGNPVAVEALAEMDKTGKVTPAYERVTERSTHTRPEAKPGRARLAGVINPLNKYLKGWDETKLGFIAPGEAARLQGKVQKAIRGLEEVSIVLDRRSVRSRVLR